MEHVDTLLGPIYKLNGNIAVLKAKDNIIIDIRVVTDVVSGFLNCFPGHPFYIIADVRNILTDATLEAMRYAAFHEELNQLCMTQVILTDNLAMKLIFNFYASTLKRNKNIKLVQNFPEAESWLSSIGCDEPLPKSFT